MKSMFRKGKSIVSLLREPENNDLRKFAKELLEFIHSSNERYQLVYSSLEAQKILSLLGDVVIGADILTTLAISHGKIFLTIRRIEMDAADCKERVSDADKENVINDTVNCCEFDNAGIMLPEEPFYRLMLKLFHVLSFIANALLKRKIAMVPDTVPYSFFHNLYAFVEQKYSEFSSERNVQPLNEDTIRVRIDACLHWLHSQLPLFSEIALLKYHIGDNTPLPPTEETILENIRPQIEAYILVDTIENVLYDGWKSMLPDYFSRESLKEGSVSNFDFSSFCHDLVDSFCKVCSLKTIDEDMVKNKLDLLDFDNMFSRHELHGCGLQKDRLFELTENVFLSLAYICDYVSKDAERRGVLSRVLSEGIFGKLPVVQIFNCTDAAHAELYLCSQLINKHDDLLSYVGISSEFCAFCNHVLTQVKRAEVSTLRSSFPWNFEEMTESDDNLKLLLGESLFTLFNQIKKKPDRFFKDLSGEKPYVLNDILKVIVNEVSTINNQRSLDLLGIPNEFRMFGLWPCG